jgi:hypothetical protein
MTCWYEVSRDKLSDCWLLGSTVLHIELAVSIGFEDCNGENLQTTYNNIRFL